MAELACVTDLDSDIAFYSDKPESVVPGFGTYPMTRRQERARAIFHDRLIGLCKLRRPWIDAFRRDAPTAVDATLFGYKVRFYPRENQTDAKGAVCGTSYNYSEIRWMRRRLKDGDTFLDIGANMGFFSLYAAKCGAQVYAIEANSNLCGRLRTNFALNSLPIGIANCAVGDVEQKVILAPHDNDLGSSKVEIARDGNIRMFKLLDIVEKFGISRIDFLKIDIEGFEDRALVPFFRDAPEKMFPTYMIMERATERERETALYRSIVKSGFYRVARRSHANILFEITRRDRPVSL